MTWNRKTMWLYGAMIAGTVLTCVGLLTAYFTYEAFAHPFPKVPIEVGGPLPIVEDPEIGFIPRPGGATRWVDRRSGLDFHLFTDHRGARVDREGAEAPTTVRWVTIGGSFAFGHGVENDQTFTAHLDREAGLGPVANLAFPSYGTVQALQVWQRNAELAPQYVLYAMIEDHLRRNLSGCAPSVSPDCLPVSHVVFEDGTPVIASPPFERALDDTDRDAFLRDVIFSEGVGLSDVYWKARLTMRRIRRADTFGEADTDDRRRQAASLLLSTLADDISRRGAQLLVIYVPERRPDGTLVPPSAALVAATRSDAFRFLDVTPAMQAFQMVPGRPPLFLPRDGHPSATGHCVIASAIHRAWFGGTSDGAECAGPAAR